MVQAQSGDEEAFATLTDAIVDQHFLRRKRYGRLLALVIERAPHLGAGIDESTALVVEAGGAWRVLAPYLGFAYVVAYLAAVVEMAHQSAGWRRIKNPRIWSLHDLKALAP